MGGIKKGPFIWCLGQMWRKILKIDPSQTLRINLNPYFKIFDKAKNQKTFLTRLSLKYI